LVDLTDSIAARTRDVQGILSEIGAIAKQTNLLALNAAIEAARAGEAGRGFAVVADEVRDLSGRTTQFSQQINAMMQSMQQSVRQTEEAIQRMASQDMTFALESKSRVAEIIETMEGENRKRADAISRLGESAGQVDTQVARAVTALQFQDMVSQLVGRVRQRVDGLHEVAGELSKLGQRIAETGGGEDFSAAIASMRMELGRIGSALAGLGAAKGESAESKSQSLAQGDIELF
ncbi:MAG: chemotaxis protein, partial [Rhodocyclaceae bacterium]|nr:chemotaxis protein [Rhodocyclaceae bacterium]